jgi:non-ribosomal peptide synthetase component F
MFVNMIALRNFPQKEKRFSDFLKDVKIQVLKGYENQDYPFEELIARLGESTHRKRDSIFDIVFSYKEREKRQKREKTYPQPRTEDVTKDNYNYQKRTTQFGLVLECIAGGNKLKFILRYNTNMYKTETILRFKGYFGAIIQSVLKHPEQPISQIEIITDEKKGELISHLRGIEHQSSNLYKNDGSGPHTLIAEFKYE